MGNGDVIVRHKSNSRTVYRIVHENRSGTDDVLESVLLQIVCGDHGELNTNSVVIVGMSSSRSMDMILRWYSTVILVDCYLDQNNHRLQGLRRIDFFAIPEYTEAIRESWF